MKVSFGVLIIFSLRCTFADNAIDSNNEIRSLVQACDDNQAPGPMSVAGSCRSSPCVLTSFEEQRLNITFVATRNCSKVTSRAWFKASIIGLDVTWIPLALTQPDACQDFKNTLKCPLIPGQTYSMIKTGPIWFLPVGSYSLKISMTCDSDDANPIFCFSFPFQIALIKPLAPGLPILGFNGK